MKFLVLFTLTILIALSSAPNLLAAEANPNDLNLQRDNERLSGDAERMQATAIAPAIECDECKKNATGGFHNKEKDIVPQGESPAKTQSTKGNSVND